MKYVAIRKPKLVFTNHVVQKNELALEISNPVHIIVCTTYQLISPNNLSRYKQIFMLCYYTIQKPPLPLLADLKTILLDTFMNSYQKIHYAPCYISLDSLPSPVQMQLQIY